MKIQKDVLAVLSRCQVADNSLTLPGQLDRQMYVKVNKIIEAAGGQWNRKAKAHLFNCDAETVVENIIATGEIVVPKDDYDFFPTPAIVADEMAAILRLKPGDRVLEPSAGDGALIDACLRVGNNLDIVAVEYNPQAFVALHVKYADNCDGMVSCYHQNFMTFDCANMFGSVEYFDKVIMNPPFRKRSDIRHVVRAFSMLKPGGTLVAVMSGGIEFRQDSLTTEFKAAMNLMSSRFIIKELPAKSFSKSGTDVNTVLITAEKLQA